MGGEGVDRAVNARFAIFLGRFAHSSVANNKPSPDDSLLPTASKRRGCYSRTLLEADWLFTGMPWGAIQKEGAFSSEMMYLLIRMFKN